jgi:hypothetical protein
VKVSAFPFPVFKRLKRREAGEGLCAAAHPTRLR